MIEAVTETAIAKAAAILRSGGLVAFPTETVYGLGANALDGIAVAKIFAAKGRPQFNPLIVHVATAADAEKLAIFDERAQRAAAVFWPGPLSLILPIRPESGISSLCTAGLPTVCLRVPAHRVAQALIAAAGCPIAAPSANRSGRLSATTPLQVAADLGAGVDMILADGPCSVGLESTVLDLSGPDALIVRPGAVDAEALSAAMGVPVAYHDITIAENGAGEAARSPGQLLRHYAPSIPLRLDAVDVAPGEALLGFGSLRFMGVRGGGHASGMPENALRNLSADGDLYEAAANLFRMLHELDRAEHRAIAVMNIPAFGIGLAINDRLRRAAQAAEA